MDFKSSLSLIVKEIKIAHKYMMKPNGSTGYKEGRGSFGIVSALSGEARFRFRTGEELTLKEGECVLFSPKAAYTTHVRREFLHYTVNFDADLCAPIDMPPCGAVSIAPKSRELFVVMLEKITAAMSHRESEYALTALGALYTLLGMFFSERRLGSIPTDRYEGILRARKYIENNYTRDFSIEELAKIANMSRTGFVRGWKLALGTPPFAFRDRLRMQRARELLLEGERSVAEISECIGFSDPAYFVRFFKKQEGTTPGAYSRKHRRIS